MTPPAKRGRGLAAAIGSGYNGSPLQALRGLSGGTMSYLPDALRKRLKRFVYGSLPGFRGRVPYQGAVVHFPNGSWSFELICEQGIFEADNVRVLQAMMRPDTWMFDVGANIGLMAIPVLHKFGQARVLSFEPSPNSVPWLERTIAGSPYKSRWELVRKAAGAAVGKSQFNMSPIEGSLFDGIQATHRIASVSVVEVEVTTLDAEWERLGKPDVSTIKIDVEGYELEVLKGARALIGAVKPSILLEWNPENISAANIPTGALLDIANDLGYRVFAVPALSEVRDKDTLRLQMINTESFLLIPAKD